MASVGCGEVAVGLAVQRHGRNGDRRLRRQLLLDVVVGRGARCEAEPMAVGVENDVDVVGVVEGEGCVGQDRFGEPPVRRVPGPDDPRDLSAVRGQARAATLGEEVVEVPETRLELGSMGVMASAMSWIR